MQNPEKSPSCYIHAEKESVLSKLIKFAFMLAGQKRGIEKDMVKGKIKQEPKPAPASISRRFKIEEETLNGKSTWKIHPGKQASGKVILYFHGGAYIYNVLNLHWRFLGQLSQTTGATVVLFDYPLAPGANCTDALDFSAKLFHRLKETTSAGEIVFMGDSAGGGLALALAMQLRNEGQPLPGQLILLSPWLDVSMRNPEMLPVDRYDKMLGIKGLQLAGEAYARPLDITDYRVSPLYGDYTGLPDISLFIGTHDLFIADARKLKLKLEEEHIRFNYFEYPRMFHDWILFPALREALHALMQLKSLIGRDL